MRIWVHRYTLTPKRRLSGIARPGPREGALLRVALRSGNSGFADLHPWPELGDAPLEEQLALLAHGDTTAQTWASLRLARCDGEARERGVSLFDGLTIPESHWPGNDPPAGFDTVKVKGTSSLPPDVRLRIDFNSMLTAGEFLRLAQRLPRERVDFVEDPCPYNERVWRALRAETHLRFALDRGVAASGVDVLVYKPALQAQWPAFNGEIVVTSYMDHPVGQFGAAFVAAKHEAQARCGLFTHVLYENDPFLERVQSDGARLLPPAGTGVGFDELLEGLPWKILE
jgi:O-succinylbenzoate synthase